MVLPDLTENGLIYYFLCLVPMRRMGTRKLQQAPPISPSPPLD